MHHEFPDEKHYVHRAGWLRAAVLGANDGLLSTSSLIIGIAASGASTREILVAGTAGLVAGAMSMAAGEYVSVSSQADTEAADCERERIQHEENPEAELKHLAKIYVERGVDPELAMQVAQQMTDHDALGTHARDELGIMDMNAARPLQAALTSALMFALGALLPLLVVICFPARSLGLWVVLATVVTLGLLGFLGARVGGARVSPAILRVIFWGAAAMGVTALVGYVFGIQLT